MTSRTNELLIIDGNALLHRAWHALPPLTTKDGTVVNAVYGFLSLLFKVVDARHPVAVAVTFDKAGKTFRHDAYDQYKATRVKQPDELYAQIPILKNVLTTLGLPIYEADGFEADDVIASIAEQAAKGKSGMNVTILTGDMDTLQLVTDKVHVLTLKKGITETMEYDPQAVETRYGLTPAQMVDYKALRGDPSDNIPGVKGVGEKTASELLQKFGTVEKLFAALKKNSADLSKGVTEKLIAGEAAAEESKKLVILVRDLKTGFSINDATLKPADRDQVVAALGALGFRSLLNRIPEQLADGGLSTSPSPSLERRGAPGGDRGGGFKKSGLKKTKTERIFIETIAQASQVIAVLKNMSAPVVVGHFSEPVHPLSNPEAIAVSNGQHTVVFSDETCTDDVVVVFSRMSLRFADSKPLVRFFLRRGVTVTPEADLLLSSYILNSGSRAHDLDAVYLERAGKELPSVPSVKGRLLAPTFGEVAVVLAERVEAAAHVFSDVLNDIAERKQEALLRDMELPLVPVLADMENTGIEVDTAFLNNMAGDLEKKIAALTKAIYKDAGEEFNINSPAQLKTVLFETLRIPTERIRKTATGAGLSTAASELEKLRELHPIIDRISEYRELTKLKNTYVDVLPTLVHADTGRVHTTYNQTIAATGRLSSIDPNLQNIPIRGTYGNEIRKAFVAPRGSVLLAADYSQIELRIIAALADDKSFIEAFNQGQDIHTRTASEIWEVDPADVTKDMRRKAKAINFGIIFGMGTHGLAQSGDMSFAEAKDALQKYFQLHQPIRKFMDAQKALAKKQGYVETVFGRRRYLPEITSGIPFVRAGAERMAINHPVQGTEADLIKLAMIAVQDALHSQKIPAKMLLQVHDELVFEVKKEAVEEASAVIRPLMEKVYRFSVPIVVDIEVGQNWGEME